MIKGADISNRFPHLPHDIKVGDKVKYTGYVEELKDEVGVVDSATSNIIHVLFRLGVGLRRCSSLHLCVIP